VTALTRLLDWLVDHPFLAGLALLVATAGLASELPGLRIDQSAQGLMVEGDPAREHYERARERFGSDNLTVVVVKADDVFTAPVLAAVERLTRALGSLDGVSQVESLTTVRNLEGDGDRLDTEPLVPTPPPTAAAELARVRRAALGNRVFVGNIIAADARTTAITVYVDPPPGDTRFNERFVAAVEGLIAREAAAGLTIYQVGTPVTRATYSEYLQRDQRTVVPLSVACLLLVLALLFRTAQGVAIPLFTGLTSIVWAVGLMALTGLPLTILTAIVPSLILAIGFAEDVHMLSEYHHRLELGDDRVTAIRAMLRQTALPITVTTLTTVVGFGSLVTTNITMLAEFGWASAMALAANFVVTLIALPVLLRWWPVPRRLRRSALDGGPPSGPIPALMERLAHFDLRHRIAILAVAGVLAAGSLVGWATLRVSTDIIGFFPERSPIRERLRDLHASLAGGLAFYVVVDTGRDDGVKDPAVLRRIAGLQDFLAATGEVDKTVSIADYIRKMHREIHGGDPARETVPDTADEVAQYLLTLEGPELAKLVDFSAAAANIVVRHHLTGSGELTALLRRIDRYVAEHFPPNVIVRPTGEAILFNNAADYMAVNELTSFSLTFLVIGLIHSALFMSFKAGALSLIPNVVPILCIYGLMGLLGIPLDNSNAMIATIAIGIAVDDTVHHMVTYSRQLRAHPDQRVAMFRTMRAQGRPIIFVSLAMAAGFLPLATSSFAPTVVFGLLGALAMLLALVGELTLTPVLMYSVRLVTLWDVLMLKMSRSLVRTAPLFQDLSTWEARKVVLLGRLQAASPGELVIQQGESGTDLYMLITGRARVFDRQPDGRETVLTVLEPGAVFGEIGLVTGEVRTASVVAETPVEVLRLDLEALDRIRRRFPYTSAKLFRNLARVLSERLRRVTAALVEERQAAGRGAVDEMVP
jgi:predicted RND superfamily exporter protein